MENLKLELTLQEINIILNRLAELPYKTSSNIIIKITTQAESQMKNDNNGLNNQ